MRLIASILASLSLLGCAPAAADCPPIAKVDAVRAGAVNPPISPSRVEAINVYELGYFCRRVPTALICAGGPGKALTPAQIILADLSLRMSFQYRDDQERTAHADFWDNDTLCGDCEDYALTLAERLHKAGQSGDRMILMMWSPGVGLAHATLLVETTEGWYEVGVGVAETPAPYDVTRGDRFGGIRMDGKRKLGVMPGYRARDDRSAIERVP